MKKLLSVVLATAMLLSALPTLTVGAADLYASGDWKYELNNGVAKIVEYTGSQSALSIPRTLDGYAVESIKDSVFINNTKITSVSFPSSLKSVSWGAFANCTNLKSIYIESGDTNFDSTIGPVFRGCTNLTSVTFADDIARVPNGVAWKLTNLKSVTIPESVTEIGSNAFSESGLTTIKFPQYLEKIDSHAFDDCDGLTEIKFPKYLKTVGYSAFEKCDNLKSINIPKNTKFGSIYGAFKYCSNLTTVTFEAGRTNIDAGMFENCTGLKSIVIPSGITLIDYNAFNGCTNLTSVSISNTVTKIAWDAFRDCTSLKSISIPNSVTSIGSSVFRGCTALENIALPNTLKTLDGNMFYGCTSLKTITLPDSITEINGGSFSGCSSLESIVLPKNLIEIGDWSAGSVFAGCTSLKTITIPATVNEIRSAAFSGCTALEKIVVPYGVKEIAKETFKGCKSLKSVTIPSTVTKIDDTAFTYYGSTTIRCVKGSTADEYAKEFDMPVEYIDEKIDITVATTSDLGSFSYTGKAIQPTVTVKYDKTTLKKDVDYRISYTNNTNAGVATMTITGIGDYTGNITKIFRISTVSMSQASVALSQTAYTYNRGIRKPAVTVSFNGKTLKNGTDYTVSYANKTIGKSTVTVTGKGNFRGSIAKSFTISLGATKLRSVSAKSRKVTLKFDKVTGATSYQVYYSTKKNSGYKKLLTTSKTTCKTKKLKKGKTYYFKVRGYGKIQGKTYYGKFSNIKSKHI